MNMIISGLSGSGKTTYSRLLAQDLKLQYISGSSLRLKHLSREPQSYEGTFWPLSPEAEALDVERLESPSLDFGADEELLELLLFHKEQVFDSWSAAWLEQKRELNLSVWLDCSLSTRARAKRLVLPRFEKSISHSEMEKRLTEKDQRARDFILKFYGKDLFEDRSVFDVILNLSYEPSEFSRLELDRGIELIHRVIKSLYLWHSGKKECAQALFYERSYEYPERLFARVPDGFP